MTMMMAGVIDTEIASSPMNDGFPSRNSILKKLALLEIGKLGKESHVWVPGGFLKFLKY
jgi:hypothetical protein